ncbi:NAD(P)-binding protein [Xylariaceae sp. FL1019]|nr:NAD(P)-binding protein [Xylariaceae sp. FL1019]
MHVLVLGASGRSGLLVVEEALSQGHTVVALVRSRARFTFSARSGVTVVEGTPFKREDITKAYLASPTPPHAVIVALSIKRVTESPFSAVDPDTPDRFMENSVANAMDAMKEHKTDRIIIMNQWGSGNSWNSMNFLFRTLYTHSPMKHGLKAHNSIDNETRAAGVKFVLVRPVILTDGDAAPVKTWPDDGFGVGFVPKISRASVARFMVDALGNDSFLGQSPVVTN